MGTEFDLSSFNPREFFSIESKIDRIGSDQAFRRSVSRSGSAATLAVYVRIPAILISCIPSKINGSILKLYLLEYERSFSRRLERVNFKILHTILLVYIYIYLVAGGGHIHSINTIIS